MSTVKNYFNTYSKRLLADYDLSKLSSHRGNQGACREIFIRNFLSQIVPNASQYVSNCEIIDSHGGSTGEVDICIYSNLSPKLQISANLDILFNDFVLAAFEIKSNLSKKYAFDAFAKIVKIKELRRDVCVYARRSKENLLIAEKTPCFLFSYDGVTNPTTYLNHLNAFALEKSVADIHTFAPDVYVNLSKNFIVIKNDGWMYPKENETNYLVYEGTSILFQLFWYLFLIIEAWEQKNIKGSPNLAGYLNS